MNYTKKDIVKKIKKRFYNYEYNFDFKNKMISIYLYWLNRNTIWTIDIEYKNTQEKKELYDLIYELLDFDFSYSLEFGSIEELREFVL